MYTQRDSPGAALDWGQSLTATIASLWRWLNNQKGIGPQKVLMQQFTEHSCAVFLTAELKPS